jgi:predicted metal-dependent phosphotriesterase family hydrolase
MLSPKVALNRRRFLGSGIAAATLVSALPLSADEPGDRQIMTVTGAVKHDALGTTLPHEHVLVDFIGADKVSRDRYDQDEVFEVGLPHLKRAGEIGCQTLVDCTPAWLGRDPLLLARLSKASGLKLLTNTGYYGAGQGKYLPPHARTEDADALAKRWLAEWEDGIEGTGIRPGLIKIGVDAGPLTEVNRKLVQAACRVHLKSGLTIAGHTGDGQAALAQLEVLRQEGVAASAWIWVHAQSEKDADLHRQAAERGAWIELDGISPTSIGQHIELVSNLKRSGHLDRVLISHDAGWYSVGEPRGGKFRSYETLFTHFLPALKEAGFTAAEIEELTIANPASALTIAVRAA